MYLDGSQSGHRVCVTLIDRDNQKVFTENATKGTTSIAGVNLWWPRDMGEAYLYTMQVHSTNFAQLQPETGGSVGQ